MERIIDVPYLVKSIKNGRKLDHRQVMMVIDANIIQIINALILEEFNFNFVALVIIDGVARSLSPLAYSVKLQRDEITVRLANYGASHYLPGNDITMNELAQGVTKAALKAISEGRLYPNISNKRIAL